MMRGTGTEEGSENVTKLLGDLRDVRNHCQLDAQGKMDKESN